MAYYAKIVADKVVKVLKGTRNFVDSLGGEWVRTSYNTIKGVHLRGNIPVRKNFAGIGFTYDRDRDAFIPIKPFNSWILDEETCIYCSPLPYPNDGKEYEWIEGKKKWVITQR